MLHDLKCRFMGAKTQGQASHSNECIPRLWPFAYDHTINSICSTSMLLKVMPGISQAQRVFLINLQDLKKGPSNHSTSECKKKMHRKKRRNREVIKRRGSGYPEQDRTTGTRPDSSSVNKMLNSGASSFALASLLHEREDNTLSNGAVPLPIGRSLG